MQTAGSAGESIAFGVGVTMPALMILGFEMDVGRVMVVAVLGGLLGILMMIPLRRAFIVRQHGTLKYPEGTACADVLIVGEQGGATAKTVFAGFGVAVIYQFLWSGMRLWKEVPSRALSWFKGAVPSIEVNPALLGVGYIIGTRISCVMCGGGVLAWLVLAPGDSLLRRFARQAALSRQDGHPQDERSTICATLHALYRSRRRGGRRRVQLDAGVAVDRRLALEQRQGFAQCPRRGAAAAPRRSCTAPIRICRCGLSAPAGSHWSSPFGRQGRLHDYVFDWIPDLHMNPLGAVLIVLFGFLFVTVSSRLTGEIGSSQQSDLRHDRGHAVADLPDFLRSDLDDRQRPAGGDFGGGDRLRGGIQRRHNVARSQNRLSRRRDAAQAAMGDSHRRAQLGAGDRRHSGRAQPGKHGLQHSAIATTGQPIDVAPLTQLERAPGDTDAVSRLARA